MNDPGLIEEFLIESHENLDQLDRDLVELEKNPRDRERLARIFRAIHTVKGTCGFLELPRLEEVAHKGENLLSRLRDGQLDLTADITSSLLALVDAIRTMLASIESTGQEGDGDYSQLIARIGRHQSAAETSEASKTSEVSLRPGETSAVAKTSEVSLPPSQNPDLPESRADGGAGAPSRADEQHATGLSESNVRVDVGLLDKLMNLVGELVLARNHILQCGADHKDGVFQGTCQRLNLITTELQEGVMKTRMQTIGNIWNKLPRVTRDLALACGKQVRMVMEGDETELDRTIIESIKDPLTHLVRNAVDHGIERPEARRAAGKPAEGLLYLRAFHESGQVNIEISDDGAGIDAVRIRDKALERGLITREQAASLSDRELLQMIFWPGFSTASQITNVSGRGVGMDVVKTNVEKIGGTVDIQSRPGQGTNVRIKIPLTLAIIPALVVSCGGDRYAIPQVSLLELVRLEGESARAGIEYIHGTPVYRLRGRLLPLVFLDQTLHGRAAPVAGTGTINIVVLQAGDRPFGLVVERVNDTQEIVVKPLGKRLKSIPLYAGATIMGDGRVALILDVLGLAQHTGVVADVRNRLPGEVAAKAADGAHRQALLLLAMGRDHQLAMPLSQVTRLEKIAHAAVERTARQEVVQHRGRILPLIRLSAFFETPAPAAAPPGDFLDVVIYSEAGRSVGLVVDRILDTVEATVDLQSAAPRPGIVGSAVIQRRVTDLLDVSAVIRMAEPTFFDVPALV